MRRPGLADCAPSGRIRLDALIHNCLRLARSAPTGRILLARIAHALDPAWVPRPWGEEIATELERARAAAGEPIGPRRVERALRDAWGTPARDELDELDPEPVAVTPTSQVHRGSVDGAPVAVKALRPGLAASVRQDLGLLGGLLPSLRAALPALDATGVMREFRERVLDEFDLEHEAASQRRFHRALRDHPSLIVPAPVTRLAREGVLVSEWVDGVPIAQAPDPGQAAAALVSFVLGFARSGIIHADPDPDDALVRPDGRLAILDFGATRTVDPERVAVAAAGLEAFARADARALGLALERLGWLDSSYARAAHELTRYALGEPGPAPVRLDGDALLNARDRLRERPGTMNELILAGALPPEDLWPARAVLQLFGTISRVGASGPWLEIARAALGEGLA